MKKRNFKFSYWMVFIAIVMGVSVSSCTKEEAVKPSGNDQVNLKVLEMTNPVPVEPAQYCDLIAGQYINVGQVISWEDAGKLFVQYVTSGDWKLYEAHVYYGLKSEMPLTKKGAPKIGQFTDSYDNLPGLTVVTFSYNIVQPKEDDCVVLATHAVVATNDDMGDEETAWSRCCSEPNLTAKVWLPSTGDWAITPGTSFGGAGWCGIMGINEYISGEENLYPLVDLSGSPVNGYLKATDNGADITFEFIDGDGTALKVSPGHIYFGSAAGISPYVDNEGCYNHYNFPYSGYSNDFPMTITGVLPMPCNSSEFEGSRWGWYSEYCK